MKKLTTLFTNFIYEELCNFNLNEIENFCMNEIKKTVSLKKSNIGGFHSDYYYENTIRNTPFENVYEKINTTMHMLCEKFELDSNLKMNNLWFVLNENSNYNLSHVHTLCIFSGAFYVKVPENSGKLYFKNPNPTLHHYVFEDKVKNFNHFNSSSWWIEPQPNKLVIFPSWLEHWVLPNLSQEKRIVLSFNYKWKKPSVF